MTPVKFSISIRFTHLFRVALLWLTLLAPSTASAQDALKDRVDQLLERLASDDDAQARSAEESLVKLGPRILSLLPDAVAKEKTGRFAERINTVRQELERSGTSSTSASRMSIEGEGLRLSEVMKALQQQSGNNLIDLREQSGQTATNPSMNLSIKDAPFFKALDEVAEKAGLSLNYYNAEGAIGYMEGMANERPPDAKSEKASEPSFVDYVEAFRVSLTRLVVSREFPAGAHSANLSMELVWEPRLRPLSIKIETSKVEAIDDKGRKLSSSVTEESMELGIRAENPIVDVNLNLTGPERDASKIATLTVQAEMTIPTAKRTLRMPDITKKNAMAEAGKSALKILDFEAEPPVWRVRVELSSSPAAGAEKVDSYREMSLSPVVSLTKADSARIPLNGGFSVGPGSGPGKLVYEFLFVDINGRPEDHGLVIEIPDELKTIPIRWTFKNIPLP